MKSILPFLSRICFTIFCMLFFVSLKAQTTILTSVMNMVQTSPNSFEYEVYITNTGTTMLELRGYSWGLNLTPGFENGGTVTHTFIERDTLFNNLPSVYPGYTPSYTHLRGTTVNAVSGNEVNLVPGIPYKIARMRVETTAPCWLNNFNPFLPVSPLLPVQQGITSGRTSCKATAIVTPPGTSFSIDGSVMPTAGTIQGLTTSLLPDPLGANPFLLNCACKVTSNLFQKTCTSFTWPLTGQTYSTSGLYTHTIVTPGACDTVFTLDLSVPVLNLSTSVSGGVISAALGATNYQWINCDNLTPISGATNQSFIPSNFGNYSVIVTMNGCYDTSLCYAVAPVGITEIANSGNTIYPNPTKGIFVIETLAKTHVTILNSIGEIVLQKEIMKGKNEIDLSRFAKGIYVVKLRSGDKQWQEKIVKEE